MRSMAWLMFLAVLFIDGVTQAQSLTGSMILAEGFASPNTYSGPLPGFFESWCADTEDGSQCIPTVTLDVFDAKKARRLGTDSRVGQGIPLNGLRHAAVQGVRPVRAEGRPALHAESGWRPSRRRICRPDARDSKARRRRTPGWRRRSRCRRNGKV